MPKVSVIIPVYNVEQYLRECLDSVINQTLNDIEIICVNDGSTDNSPAILEEYAQKDSRIKIIHKENGGLSSARNCAIEIAQGEYIGFVDSDDWIDLDFYEKLYTTATKYGAEVACAELFRVSDDKKKNKYFVKFNSIKTAKKTHHKYKLAFVPQHNYVMNKIYHTKKLQKSAVKFEDKVLYEDVLWTHKVVHYLQKLVVVPNTKYNYRDNPYSIVNTHSDKNSNAYDKAFRQALAFVNKKNIRNINPDLYPWIERAEYRFLGIPLIRIKKFYGITQYSLFGIIPIWEIKKNYRNNEGI